MTLSACSRSDRRGIVQSATYLGSRSLKRKEPHLKLVSLKSGSPHPRLTITHSPAYHTTKLSSLGDEGQVLGQMAVAHFWSPPGKKKKRRSQDMDSVVSVFTLCFEVLRCSSHACLLHN